MFMKKTRSHKSRYLVGHRGLTIALEPINVLISEMPQEVEEKTKRELGLEPISNASDGKTICNYE